YRQGRGSVTAHPNPDYLKWDPTVRPLIEWDDDTDGYGITLEDFLAASGLTLTRYARFRAWLRRFLDRWGR
ncbi:hypothetical protein PV365_43490, partial [Streptomyces scabiei]|nr:hypothetical protein [Streptomyces scabiei]